jgi:hypothetical protein
MTSQHLRLSLFACVLLAASPLAAQKINVEFDQGTDFTKYKTFAIRGGQVNSKDPSLSSELTRKRIETDIENALTARGLTKNFGRADLNVRYRLGAQRKTEVERHPAGWRGLGTRVVRVPETEGTLVLDLHDAAAKSLVWRAIASEEKSSANDISKKLDDMVRKSFDKYPPKK